MAQEIITLPHKAPEGVVWKGGEKAYFSEDWNTDVICNVSLPSMQVFKPSNPNGTSVVIAPGGGFYALSIRSEGTMVGEWLAERGVTAFVLKYRLIPTENDGVKEFTQDGQKDIKLVEKKVGAVLPYAIKDALEAIHYVRENADSYNLDPQKIGLMGFSAGGAVVMGSAYNYTSKNRPNFLIPVYAWTRVFDVEKAPSDAPPICVVCSSDDPLGLAPGSIEIYSAWHSDDKSASLHMYAKGGHGFGMRTQGLPSDHWIERVHEWMQGQGILE